MSPSRLFFLFCLFHSVAFGALEAVVRFGHECTSYPADAVALTLFPPTATRMTASAKVYYHRRQI